MTSIYEVIVTKNTIPNWKQERSYMKTKFDSSESPLLQLNYLTKRQPKSSTCDLTYNNLLTMQVVDNSGAYGLTYCFLNKIITTKLQH